MSEEQSLDDAYAVFEWMTTVMQKVAADPKKFAEFLYVYTEKLPEIIDASMRLVTPLHYPVVGELLKASGKMAAEVLLWSAKK